MYGDAQIKQKYNVRTTTKTMKMKWEQSICGNVKVLHTHKILYARDYMYGECWMFHLIMLNVIMTEAMALISLRIECKFNF